MSPFILSIIMAQLRDNYLPIINVFINTCPLFKLTNNFDMIFMFEIFFY